MYENEIKKLFDNFDPELSSSFQFMDRLKRNMDAVEIVRRRTDALKKRSRIAVAIAAVSGFAAGVVFTLLFPLFSSWASTYIINIPHLQISTLTIDYSFVAWIMMAGVSIVTAMNVYEIALARLSTWHTR